MNKNIVRVFLFVVFFSIGAAALSSSILCGDLLRSYYGRCQLEAAEESLARLESLNADYDVLLRQMEKDPDIVRRITAATLGIKPNDKDTIYPKATVEQLAIARKALTEDLSRKPTKPIAPGWLSRCNKSPNRLVLFLSGGFLILISFMWFGKADKRKPQIQDKV